MPFCPHCGKEIEEGTVFCPYCGMKIDAPFATADGTPQKSNPSPSAETTPETKEATPVKSEAAAKGTSSSDLITPYVCSIVMAGMLLAYVARKGWDTIVYAFLFVCCLFLLISLIRTLTYIPSDKARARLRKKLSPGEASLESERVFSKGGISLFFRYAGTAIIILCIVFFVASVVLLSLLSLF